MLRSGTNLSPVLLMRPSLLALSLLSALSLNALAAALPIVSEVEWQPFVAQVRRLIEATDYPRSIPRWNLPTTPPPS